MIKPKNNQKVFIGLSGGVDSSVAAALLKKRGYEVVGIFMRFWSEEKNKENGCCSVEAEAAARLVAKKLAIPFYVWNFGREFKEAVVDYFLAELRAGRTPNPCVVCNPQIKFGLFLERAIKLGANFVATGHYARLRREVSIPNDQFSKKSKTQFFKNIYKLFAAKDKTKDQSYFLYGLKQQQLSKIIFPLGRLSKKEVYALASKMKLPYRPVESFDICFIDDYQRFLKKYLKMKPGKIIFSSVIPTRLAEAKTRRAKAGIQKPGSRVKPGMTDIIVGRHEGLALYTIGQRTGVGGPGPFYAVKKDGRKNILYVSNNECDLQRREITVGKINWLSGRLPKLSFNCQVKIRYRNEGAKAVVKLYSKNKAQIIFNQSQWAPTPGQSAVFYGKSGEILGGGIIEK